MKGSKGEVILGICEYMCWKWFDVLPVVTVVTCPSDV